MKKWIWLVSGLLLSLQGQGATKIADAPYRLFGDLAASFSKMVSTALGVEQENEILWVRPNVRGPAAVARCGAYAKTGLLGSFRALGDVAILTPGGGIMEMYDIIYIYH